MTERGTGTLAAAAAERFRAIVGAENVRLPGDDGFTAAYSDPFSFDDEYALAPAGAVLPASTAEVQDIVRAANTLGVPLWPVSRGRNLGYGGAAPRSGACVVLDLQRLDQVVEVNAESAYAVVEPGVSFFTLADRLREEDAALWPSVPDLGGGSVIGNALERGFGYTAYGDHSAQLCGLEVVLPDGELLRTGMWAQGGDSGAAHLYKGGFGPGLDGLFLQSNLGVVVRAGIWLMPRPEVAAACLITVPDPGDLAALVDLVRPLMLERTIDSVAIVGNALAIASQLMPRAAIHPDHGPIPLEVIRAFAAKLGLGYWNAKFGLYGAREVVEAKLAVVRARLSSVPHARLEVREYPGDVSPESVHPADRAQLGIPSADLIQMAAWRGGEAAHTDFSVVAPTRGAEAQELVDLVRQEVEAEGLDHVGGFTMFGRHAVMLTLLSFDRSSETDRDTVARLFTRLVDRLAEAGHVPYRAHPAFMDRIAALYDFNDGAYRRTVGKLKQALDPRGVLAPGKQGIWPAEVGPESPADA